MVVLANARQVYLHLQTVRILGRPPEWQCGGKIAGARACQTRPGMVALTVPFRIIVTSNSRVSVSSPVKWAQ